MAPGARGLNNPTAAAYAAAQAGKRHADRRVRDRVGRGDRRRLGLLDHEASPPLAAAKLYRDTSRPLQRAKALEAAAGEFISTGELREARAVEIYEALGASADVARLQAVFRAHGIRRGPHSKHRQADSGWASLTPTEVKVAALIEEGLSNPDIAEQLVLSPRTVGTHVSHMLKKLDVHSRTDIARESVLRTITPG